MRWRIVVIAVISIAVFGAQTAHASVIELPPNNIGLVGYWSFNEGTSTIANDYSGNGTTGTLTTTGSNLPQWVPGKFGSALSFDGSSNYVNVPNGFTLSSGYTWCAWMESPNAPTTTSGLSLPISNKAAWGFNWNYNNSSYVQAVWHDTSSGYAYAQLTTPLQANTWYFICGSWDGSNDLDAYLNGTLQTTTTGVTSAEPPGGPFEIGAYSSGSNYFNGTIDDVRIYDRALSATEVAGLYQNGLAKINVSQSPGTLSQGLVGWWTMDGADTVWSSPTAGVEYDSSGSDDTGTLNGMTRSGSPTVGKIGQALSFNGSTQYVSVPRSSSLEPTSVTVTAWVKVAGHLGHAQAVLLKTYQNDSTPPWVSYGLGYDRNGDYKFEMDVGNTSDAIYYTQSNGALTPNEWEFIAGTYDEPSGTVSLYLNGKYDSGGTFTGPLLYDTTSSGGLYLSSDGGATPPYADGDIDDVRVYNRALSASEIQQLYTLGAGTHVNTSSANLQRGSSLSQGLVGYWTFDGPTISGTTVDDLSGQGNNGTNNGATPTIGKIGQALSFNGSSSYVDIPNASSLEPTAVTVSAWVDPSSNVPLATCGGNSTAEIQYILFKRNTLTSGFEGYFLDAYPSGSQIFYGFGLTSSGGVSDEVDSSPYNINQWHHLVGVFQQPNLSFYIDGVLVNTVTHNYPVDYGTHDVFIDRSGECGGAGYANWDGYFGGKIDDVRIYNRALSASEVQDLYLMGQ